MSYKKILIVDDEEEALRLMHKKLAAEGYQVICAKRADDAIEKARAEMPDLILMDIMLPDIDGSEAVKLIQAEPAIKGIPVIFISGILSKEENEEAGLNLKVAGRPYYAFPKPFTPETLIAKIEEVVGLDH